MNSNYPAGAEFDPAAPWNDDQGYHVERRNVTVTIEIPDMAVEVSDDTTEDEIKSAIEEQISITSLPSGAWVSDIEIE